MSQTKTLKTLSEQVLCAMEHYFCQTHGATPQNIYNLVIGEIEPPLFKSTLEHAQGNQSLAAEMLGINRATLRKKLQTYDLI